MKLVVFGANGATGRLLTEQALVEGHSVTAFTRHPETFPLRQDRLPLMRGDVFELAAVEQAVCVLVLVIALALPILLPVFHFPKPTGPYAIGTLTYHWVDPSRPELFTADPSQTGPINAQRGYDIVNAYSVAFFDKELKGQPSPLLNGPSKQYPEVNIEIRPF